MEKEIILASASPRRNELLKKTGLSFAVIPSTYVEDMTLPLTPNDLVLFLSKQKAVDVAKRHPRALIIAADTIIDYEGKVIGKPKNVEEAKKTLRALSGSAHRVVTGFTVLDAATGKTVSQATGTNVYFKRLTLIDIEQYVATGEPMDKAGAYAIQGIAKKFVEKIDGDYTNVVGLPINDLVEVLKQFGVSTETNT